MPKSKEITKEQVLRELKEAIGAKLVDRKEAPLIGLIFFSIALWGSKIFTFFSPTTYIQFSLLGYTVHLHHFHFGIIAIVVGILVMFVEGKHARRFAHMLFGAGLGLIADEYLMLLLLDESAYFSSDAFLVSAILGIGLTVIYGLIVVFARFFTRREREIWTKFYKALEEGKIEIEL